MIVVNGYVDKQLKKYLIAGGQHPVARRYGNLIIAGGMFGANNLWDSDENPFEVGAIASANGNNSESKTRLRSADYIAVEPNTTYSISSNVGGVFVLEYGANKSYLNKSSGWNSVPYTFQSGGTTGYIRIVVAHSVSDSTAIIPSDLGWFVIEKA